MAFAGSDTKKHILMLLENNPYPQDTRVRREAKSLVAAGYDVTVISPKGSKKSGADKTSDIVDGVNVLRYPAPLEISGAIGFIIEFAYSLIAASILTLYLYVRKGFDAIHAHNPPDMFVLIAMFYKLLGKRFVFDHHDLSPEMYEAKFPGKSGNLIHKTLLWLERLTFRMSDHVIATNESYKRFAMERGGKHAEQISIVRNGPDLNRLKLVEQDSDLLAMNKALFGYVGVMGVQDGLDYLLRALHELKTNLNRDDFFAVIIGKGEALEGLRVLAKELGLEEHVRLTGRVSDEDLLRYLSTIHVGTAPDPENGFNEHCTMIKMTEYMALAKPIVAFDLTEHRFTAQDASLYAKPNSELDFARCLMQLMDDPELRSSMGDKGRHRIVNELSWDYSVPHLLGAYEAVFQTAQPELQVT